MTTQLERYSVRRGSKCTADYCRARPYYYQSLPPHYQFMAANHSGANSAANGSKVVVALYQACSTPGEVATNLKVIKEQMKRASLVGASLVIFPEMFTTGYYLPEGTSGFKQLAEPHDGHCFEEIAATAKDLGVGVIYGYPELETVNGKSVYYNSAQFIDKNGVSLANYRKTHLWPAVDRQVFTAGDKFANVVDFNGLKIGLLICYDVEFPENVRSLVLQGANFIAVPTAVQYPYTHVTNMVSVRAMENQVFIAYVNHCGEECGVEMLGHTCCCGPCAPVVMAGPTMDMLLLATIDPEECEIARARYNYLADRRPHLYKNIVNH